MNSSSTYLSGRRFELSSKRLLRLPEPVVDRGQCPGRAQNLQRPIRIPASQLASRIRFQRAGIRRRLPNRLRRKRATLFQLTHLEQRQTQLCLKERGSRLSANGRPERLNG
jgi:hypothetical protein